MVKSKRILSVVLAILMVLTMCPVAMFTTASATESFDTAASAVTDDGKLVMPSVTLSATPVFRLAGANDGSVASLNPGTKLTSATPSGLPYINSSYAEQYYAGESPAAPKVVFTSDKALSGTPSIQASVPGLTFAGPEKSGNTYTWTVSGGNNDFSRGRIDITVGYTYKYTDSYSGNEVTKNYNAYTSVNAEYITQPSGVFVYRERKAPWTTHEAEHMCFAVRLVGSGSFASFAGTGSGVEHGVYNFFSAGNNFYNINKTAESAAPYGMVHFDGDHDSTDGNYPYGTAVDRNRPVANIYADRNGGQPSLETSNNLRISVFEGENRSDYDRYVRGIYALDGLASFDNDTGSNAAAATKIGLQGPAQEQKVAGYSHTEYPLTGNTFNPGSADEATGNYVSSFTIVSNVGTYYTKSDRVSNSRVGMSLIINSYDKSELRGYIADLMRDNDPLHKITAESEIGLNPQSQFYSAGWSAYETALHNAQGILAKEDTTQVAIDGALESLQTAVAGLEVKGADFSAYNVAMDRFNSLDGNKYTATSWNDVLTAFDAVAATADYSVFYQNAVDKLVKDFNTAMDNLVGRPADWEKVETAIEAYESYEATDYTSESWTVLKNAVNVALAEMDAHGPETAEYYTSTQQAYVDSLAFAISDAIDALEFGYADFSAFDAQLARYEQKKAESDAAIAALTAKGVDCAALGITSIYTEATVRTVENNMTIDRNLRWPDQSKVNSKTATLKSAIDKLKIRPAIYAGVDDALEAAGSYEESWYTEESYGALMDACDAVDSSLDITKQDVVNGYEQAIRDAIEALEPALGNYNLVNDYVSRAENLDPDDYTEASYNNLMNVVNNINWSYMAKDQDKITLIENALKSAIEALVMVDADYSAVDTQIARWENNYKANATNYSNAADVVAAISNVVRGKKKNEQAAVDQMAANIKTAIDNLQLKPADYSAYDAQLARANAAVSKQTAYAAANNGYAYYTSDTFSALTTYMATLPAEKNKTILEQADVDAMTAALMEAVDGLKVNGADYSALITALTAVPSDEDLEALYTPETAANVVIAAMEGQSAVDAQDYTVEQQGEVDALTSAVIAAVAALELKDADYTGVYAAKARIPDDLSIFTAESVSAVNAAVAAVVEGKKITEQDTVDAWAVAIEDAVVGLTPWYADYSAVDAAISAAEGKIASGMIGATENMYTDESIDAVRQAENDVVRGKYHKDQADVDAMAVAINAAADALTEKPLDLTSYNAAVAKEATKGDLSKYTAESVAAMNSAKSAADFFKSAATNDKITKQAEFEALVSAYDAAIDALKLNAADYTLVDEYIAEADGLNKDNYVSFADVDTAIAAVVRDLDGSKQGDVDAMAAAIRAAIDALQLKPLDLTAYNAAAALEATKGDLDNYKADLVAAMNDAKAAADAYKADKATNVITNQSYFDNTVVKAYEDAINALELKGADYTALDKLAAYAANLNPDWFENYYDVYWAGMYELVEETIPSNHDYDILHQADVDAMTDELQGYIDMLVAYGADYTAVDAEILKGDDEVAKNWYTDESVAARAAALPEINRDYKIWEQDTVDAYIPEIEAANALLQLKPADYTEVDALAAYVNTLLETAGYDEAKDIQFTNFDDIYWTYMFGFIEETLPEQRDYLMDEQSKVDALRDELQSYIDMLEYEPTEPVEKSVFELTNTATLKNGTYIIGLRYNLTRTDFEKNFTYQENVKVTYSNAASRRVVGTGTVVTATSTLTNEVIAEYTIIIFGDVDGDGSCTALDEGIVTASLKGGARLNAAQTMAADVTGRRAGVDSSDAALMTKIAKKTVTMPQDGTKI